MGLDLTTTHPGCNNNDSLYLIDHHHGEFLYWEEYLLIIRMEDWTVNSTYLHIQSQGNVVCISYGPHKEFAVPCCDDASSLLTMTSPSERLQYLPPAGGHQKLLLGIFSRPGLLVHRPRIPGPPGLESRRRIIKASPGMEMLAVEMSWMTGLVT